MNHELPPNVAAWRDRGRYINVLGIEVFIVDWTDGGAARDSEEATLILHGFPTSSSDWRHALPVFGANRRVILFDFPGFGLSGKPTDYSYSLIEQADVAELVLRSTGVRRAHVIAHDMGTSVACELLARRERGLLSFDARSLLLTNGSVYPELARLTPSQKLLRSPAAAFFNRLSSERVFRWQMKKLFGPPVDDQELVDMWAQLQYEGGKRLLPRLIGYVDDRYRFWHRWIGALRRLDLPALALWGPLDPVAVLAIGERLAREIPNAELRTLEGLGHYPMLEHPQRFGEAVARFLGEVG